MLSKIVKAGSITNLTDARFFAAYDVDFIGFNFDPKSPDYISPQNALAIKGWITGPKIVAEFANQDIDNIKNIIQFFEPDFVEVDDSFMATILPELQQLNMPVIVRTNQLFSPQEDVMFYVTSITNLQQIKDVSKYIFDLSETTDDLPELNNILAIQLKGSPEMEVGIKSFDHIANMLEQLTL
jgi:phosphoribosylanthranilate isomerase